MQHMQDYIHDTACLYERWASGDSSSFLVAMAGCGFADSRIGDDAAGPYKGF